MILSNMWQIGRKLKALVSPASKGILGALSKIFETILWCESITPLGFPVVPDVYIIVAKSDEETLFFRSSTSN